MKYKHQQTGVVVTKKKDSDGYETEKTQFFFPGWAVENTSDWEKVENEWKATYLRSPSGAGEFYYLKENGKYNVLDLYVGAFTLEELLSGGFEIYTVTNGREGFSLGDMIEYDGEIRPIENMEIRDNVSGGLAFNFDREVCGIYASMWSYDIVKKPTVLYTTQDGVKRYDWQSEYQVWVDPKTKLCKILIMHGTSQAAKSTGNFDPDYLSFSTLEAAEAYADKVNEEVIMNMPLQEALLILNKLGVSLVYSSTTRKIKYSHVKN